MFYLNKFTMNLYYTNRAADFFVRQPPPIAWFTRAQAHVLGADAVLHYCRPMADGLPDKPAATSPFFASGARAGAAPSAALAVPPPSACPPVFTMGVGTGTGAGTTTSVFRRVFPRPE